jgi:hypothetical protein
MTYSVTATYEYQGFVDYWGGNGRRWNDERSALVVYLCAQNPILRIQSTTRGGRGGDQPRRLSTSCNASMPSEAEQMCRLPWLWT